MISTLDSLPQELVPILSYDTTPLPHNIVVFFNRGKNNRNKIFRTSLHYPVVFQLKSLQLNRKQKPMNKILYTFMASLFIVYNIQKFISHLLVIQCTSFWRFFLKAFSYWLVTNYSREVISKIKTCSHFVLILRDTLWIILIFIPIFPSSYLLLLSLLSLHLSISTLFLNSSTDININHNIFFYDFFS